MAPPLWLAVATVAVTAASASCPTDFQLDRGNCYWEAPFGVDWQSGELTCYTKFPGSHMVSIHDILENAFVFETMATYSTWTGLRRIHTDSDWYWTDGTPANWTNWCDGQPAGDGERFAWLSGASNGCWSTSSVTGYTNVVCKLPENH